jgi:hypothetical protein
VLLVKAALAQARAEMGLANVSGVVAGLLQRLGVGGRVRSKAAGVLLEVVVVGLRPLSMEARAGMHRGLVQQAWVKATPSCASRSTLGVR